MPQANDAVRAVKAKGSNGSGKPGRPVSDASRAFATDVVPFLDDNAGMNFSIAELAGEFGVSTACARLSLGRLLEAGAISRQKRVPAESTGRGAPGWGYKSVNPA